LRNTGIVSIPIRKREEAVVIVREKARHQVVQMQVALPRLVLSSSPLKEHREEKVDAEIVASMGIGQRTAKGLRNRRKKRNMRRPT